MGQGVGSAVHATALMGTVSGTVVAARPMRKYLRIQNDSDTAIYLRLGTTAAVVSFGIRVNSNGDSYEMTPDKGNIWTGVITGISASASKTLLITDCQ